MEAFDASTREAIGYYVYCLIDPSSGKPFYVGKGTGDRVFAHARGALENPHDSDKLNIIRRIIDDDRQVGHVIVRHGLNEETAFAIETAIIDFACRFDIKLENVALGRKSSAFGIMTADEVLRKYQAEPLRCLPDGFIIININRTYRRAKGSKSYYEATKESWVIASRRVPDLKYVLSEYRGFIVEVFEVENWYTVKDHNGKGRWGFNGVQAPDGIRDSYLNCSINRRRGAANPITYRLPG